MLSISILCTRASCSRLYSPDLVCCLYHYFAPEHLLLGCIALIWCVVWWAVVEDSPDQDRSITDAELEYLRNTIGVTTKEVGLCFIQTCLIQSFARIFSLKLVLKIRDYKTLNVFKVCVKLFYDIVQKLNTTKEFLEYLTGLFMIKFRGHFVS